MDEQDTERLREHFALDGGSTRLVGRQVKLTSHHDSPVMVCDYVYYGTLLHEDRLTYTILTGYTKVTTFKDNTTCETWEG